MTTTNSILFKLEDDVLIVASTGDGFSRTGVMSVCNMDLSNKSTDENETPSDDYGDKDAELVKEILDSRIIEYERYPNRMREDINKEKSVGNGYAGRFLWELLQNADDANLSASKNICNAQMIGAKGLGFKSVLEISAEPQVYSGEFCWEFSREKSLARLDEIPKWKAGKKSNGKDERKIPVCRLPHPMAPDDQVQVLWNAGYSTVIRLPLREGKKEYVGKKLNKICGSWLLFCQALKTIDIQIGDKTRCISARCSSIRGQVDITDTDKSDPESWHVWREFAQVSNEKKLSVAVCLPLVAGKINACDKPLPLSVFFPTKVQVDGVYALLHASCEVEDNRKHLAGRQPNGDEICEMLRGLVEKILLEAPANTALRAFGPAAECDTDEKDMCKRLAGAVAEAVRCTVFVPTIGGGKVTPGEVRLWGHGLGKVLRAGKVRDENLCGLGVDKKSREILAHSLKAEKLSPAEHAELLKFCCNDSTKNCLEVWRVADKLMAEWDKKYSNEHVKSYAESLKTVPFWRVNNGQPRAINGEHPLVWEKPKACPTWLAVDEVDAGFAAAIKGEEKRLEKESYDIVPVTESNGKYFDKILLPYCEKLSPDDWQQKGWEILKLALEWGVKSGAKELLVLDSGDDIEKRAAIMHLPVGKNGDKWQPAWQCYAGKAWGGPGVFDRYFATIDNRDVSIGEQRYVLSPSDAWNIKISEDNLAKWKNLLEWLGCSWMPKLVTQKERYAEIPYIHNTGWIIDFYFEHFDKMCDTTIKSDQSLLKQIPAMYKISKKMAQYSYRGIKFTPSSAKIQLKTKTWVPCKRSLLNPDARFFAPSDSYLPGFKLGSLLPQVDKGSLDADAWKEIEDILKELGANDCIPKDRNKIICYMNALSECADKEGSDLSFDSGKKNQIGRAAMEIFDIFNDFADADTKFGGLDGAQVRVPCVKLTPQGKMLEFHEVDKVYWADKPYFDEQVRQEILCMAEPIFFRFMSEGEAFSLPKLSEFLQMKSDYGDLNQQATKCLRARYLKRHIGMEKATKQKFPDGLEITAYDGIILKSNKHEKINPTIQFWKESENKMAINVACGNNMWRNLGAALANVAECSDCKTKFETLLNEETSKGFLSRLRGDYGLSEEALEAAVNHAKNGATHDFSVKNSAAPHIDSDSEVANASNPSGQIQSGNSTGSHASGGTRNGGGGSAGGMGGASGASPPVTARHELSIKAFAWSPKRKSSAASIPGNGGGGDSEQRSESMKDTGKHGEEALFKWLCKEFGDNRVTDMNKAVQSNHPGYDFEVERNGETHYYECKSFAGKPPSKVSVSSAQYKIAQKHGERYNLCILYDLDTNSPRIHPLISNPAVLQKEPDGYLVHLTNGLTQTESTESSESTNPPESPEATESPESLAQ